jgi:hypothetical protein
VFWNQPVPPEIDEDEREGGKEAAKGKSFELPKKLLDTVYLESNKRSFPLFCCFHRKQAHVRVESLAAA